MKKLITLTTLLFSSLVLPSFADTYSVGVSNNGVLLAPTNFLFINITNQDGTLVITQLPNGRLILSVSSVGDVSATNIAGKQIGSMVLSNFLRMGISNIVAANGVAIGTNNGTLWITNIGIGNFITNSAGDAVFTGHFQSMSSGLSITNLDINGNTTLLYPQSANTGSFQIGAPSTGRALLFSKSTGLLLYNAGVITFFVSPVGNTIIGGTLTTTGAVTMLSTVTNAGGINNAGGVTNWSDVVTKGATISQSGFFDTTMVGDFVLQSDPTGLLVESSVTSTELSRLTGVTGGIQTNLNARVANNNGVATNLSVYGLNNFGVGISGTSVGGLSMYASNGVNWQRIHATDNTSNIDFTFPTNADSGAVVATATSISNVAFSILSTVSATELGYLDGVTSPIQTQLNNKIDTIQGVSIAGLALYAPSTLGGFTVIPLTGMAGANIAGIFHTNGWIFSGWDSNFLFFASNALVNGSLTMTKVTASRPAYINANGQITNASGTPDGTKFMRDDGVLATPTGTGTGNVSSNSSGGITAIGTSTNKNNTYFEADAYISNKLYMSDSVLGGNLQTLASFGGYAALGGYPAEGAIVGSLLNGPGNKYITWNGTGFIPPSGNVGNLGSSASGASWNTLYVTSIVARGNSTIGTPAAGSIFTGVDSAGLAGWSNQVSATAGGTNTIGSTAFISDAGGNRTNSYTMIAADDGNTKVKIWTTADGNLHSSASPPWQMLKEAEYATLSGQTVKTGIDGKATGATPIFTNTYGKDFVVESIIVRPTTVTGLAVPSTLSIGKTASSYVDVITATTLTGLTAITGVAPLSPILGSSVLASNDVLNVNISGGATATSYTLSVYVFGRYLNTP